VSSSYAIHNGLDRDSFVDLYADITQYSMVGEVVLLGDFNSCTKALQIPLQNQSDDVFYIQEIDPKLVGLHRMSDNALGPLTAYGWHLQHLRESQEFFILNGLPCFLDSLFFMCWPHNRGVSVVDYVLSSQNLLPFIHHFSVFVIPLQTMLFFPTLSKLTPPLPQHPSQGPSRTIF
jgi:hypothetical protein